MDIRFFLIATTGGKQLPLNKTDKVHIYNELQTTADKLPLVKGTLIGKDSHPGQK